MKPAQVLKIKRESKENRFYVYYHTDENGNIFYIGKGHYNRAYIKRNRSSEWNNVVNNCESYGVCFFVMGLTDEESRELEKKLIKAAFEEGLPIVNKTCGGQGVSKKISKETLEKIRAKRTKRIYCYQNGNIYNGTGHVSEELNLNQSHVSLCCKNKLIQAKGYEFDYLENVNKEEIGVLRPMSTNIRAGIRVICEQNGKVYKSGYEAYHDLKIDRTSLARHLKGTIKHASGYTFKKYVEGMKITIKPRIDIPKIVRPKIKCLDNGIIYRSLYACSRDIKVDERMIKKVCEKKRLCAKNGLRFEYYYDTEDN
jgi:hypothetical protein